MDNLIYKRNFYEIYTESLIHKGHKEYIDKLNEAKKIYQHKRNILNEEDWKSDDTSKHFKEVLQNLIDEMYVSTNPTTFLLNSYMPLDVMIAPVITDEMKEEKSVKDFIDNPSFGTLPQTLIHNADFIYYARMKDDGTIVANDRCKFIKIPTEIKNQCTPNHINYPPERTEAFGFPPDTERTLVAYGRSIVPVLKDDDHNFLEDLPFFLAGGFLGLIGKNIIKEKFKNKEFVNKEGLHTYSQYWRRSTNSYSILPNQTKRVVLEHVSGVTNAYTITDTLSTSVSASLSGSYEMLSGALSGAFNKTSTTITQLVLTEQNTMTIEDVIRNDSDETIYVVFWELVDVIKTYVFEDDLTYKVQSVIENVQSPPEVRIYPKGAKFKTLKTDVS